MSPREESFPERMLRQSDDAAESKFGGRPNGTTRHLPLFQYTGQIDGLAIRVDVVWDGSEPIMKWSTHDPA
ncbi:hypothetical protein [Curtobacterium sp. USHLN213]|uniref:hypothetical protein n=1 Tax=Curtobacterium sp. USHLN213 TaxID=3081255 RepID=UPI0030184CA8